jgi:tRNA(Ile)-lysidine synthase
VTPIDDLLGRCDFPSPGTAVDVGVSGGADSSALLVLAVAAGCEVTAVHVDHGLRDGSTAESQSVATLAARFGAHFRSVRVDVPDGPNLEARARDARYAALGAAALVGHTLDDRAETVLLHLLRGTGAAGLAALSPPDPRRPLLRLRRADTVALCAAADIVVVEDPSNADPRFTRNRVRRELLPLLDDISGRDSALLLTRTADLIAADDGLLCELAESLDPTDASAIAAAPVPLSTRSLRRWLAVAHEGFAPDTAEVTRVLDVARGAATATELAGGARLARTNQRLRIVPGGPESLSTPSTGS